MDISDLARFFSRFLQSLSSLRRTSSFVYVRRNAVLLSAAMPLLAVVFLAVNYFTNGRLLNALEAIPTTYLSSNTTSAAQAAGTLISALAINGFTLGSPALVNSIGTPLTSTSFTYTSDGNTSTAYTRPFGAQVFGNYLFITHNGDDRISVYDISTTESPVYLTEFSTACTIGDILIASSTLYVTNYTGASFRVYDLTASTTAPTFIRTVATGNYPIGMAKSPANYIYVANNTDNTIKIYDAASSTNPTLSSTYSLPSNNPTGLAIKGTNLYVAHYDQAIVRTLSISTPAAPTNVTTNAVGTNPMSVATNGQNVLLVSNFGANTISQLNITTPAAPVASGNSSFSAGGTNPAGIAFSSDGKEAYIVNNGSNSFTAYNMGKEKYVAWNWKCGATSGCDIKTWTGNGANRTIAHSLGATPAMIIVKRTDVGSASWNVYHQSANASPATGILALDSTQAFTVCSTCWNNTAPTASNFTLGTNIHLNNSGNSYIAYLFAEKPGFSKFGSYTGNGSADGPFVYTGFKPRYLMIKRTDTASSWRLFDTARNISNPAQLYLFADLTDVEATVLALDMNGNGFKMRDTSGGWNASGGSYIYAAFAEYPFEYASTNGNGLSIATSTRFNGTNAYLSRTPGSAGDRRTWTWSGWVKRSALGNTQQIFATGIDTNNAALLYFDSSNRIQWADRISAVDLAAYTTSAVYRDPSAWHHIVLTVDTTQASPGNRVRLYVNGTLQTFTATTAYSQNATGNINVNQAHAIGRSAFTALDYYSGYLSDIYFIDGQAVSPTSFAGADTNGRWSPKTFTGSFISSSAAFISAALSNGFTLGSQAIVNTLNDAYVAWTWKESSTSGFDIVTYTGTGANRTVAHTLGATPAFMLVKRTDSAANWTVWHQSLTPTTTGYLVLNSTAAQSTSATMWNSTAPTSALISLGTDATVNANGGTYTAYLWADKPGFSKFGSYTGHGSADGPFVYTGFKPRYLLMKNIANGCGATNWHIRDTARSTSNPVAVALGADGTFSEYSGTYDVDFLANGFKVRTTNGGTNCNGDKIVYAAFAEYPFEYATTNSGLSIASSTRFNGTNASLTRTPSSTGSRTTWTWSGWVKRGALGTDQYLFASNGTQSGDSTWIGLKFNSSNQLNLLTWATDLRITNAVYRDPSAWMHVVLAVDTTQATASNRFRIYVNGTEVTSFATSNSLAQNAVTGMGQTVPLYLSTYNGSLLPFSGYMSDIHFVDGQQLSPTAFAQSDSNGRWSPIAYSGTYGTNGFRLEFASSTNPGLGTGYTTATVTQTITTTGAGTFTVPNYVGTMTVQVWGGGGGGGAGSACTVPSLGNAGTGGSSTFSPALGTLTAGGGAGGFGGCQSFLTGPSGPTASGGDINTSGTAGGTSNWFGGNGGTAPNGGAGGLGTAANSLVTGGAGSAAGGGGGGGGGDFNAQAAGTGGASGAYVSKSYAQGAMASGTSVSYFIGAGGAGGTPCCSGSFPTPGGAGARGQITITYAVNTANSFAANNIAATDNIADSPTNNFATWNPIYYDTIYSGNRLTLSSGNLNSTSNASIGTSQATVLPSSGKWYWETQLTGISVAGTDLTGVGLIAADGSDNRVAWEQTYANACGAGTARGLFIVTSGTITTCSNTLTNATNDVIGIAYDADNRKVWFSSNGSFVYGGNPALGTSPDATISNSIQWYPFVTGRGASNTHSTNFGQGGQSGLTYDASSGGYFKYTPPSGFKALSSANMISQGTTDASLVKSNNWFDAITYTGTGASSSITSLSFQPDLIWIKDRTSALNHVISDVVSGITCYLSSNTTSAKTCGTSNSFHLPLAGTSTIASVGTDTSGMNNFFTNNNIAATDAVIDTPTNNFAVLNPLDNASQAGASLRPGNLYWVSVDNGGASILYPTIIPSSGKWYIEGQVYNNNGSGNLLFGLLQGGSISFAGGNSTTASCGRSDSIGPVGLGFGVCAMAIDMDAGKVWMRGPTGTWVGGGDPAAGTLPTVTYTPSLSNPTKIFAHNQRTSNVVSPNASYVEINFGQGMQEEFGHGTATTYDSASGGRFRFTPPSGFKALSSANMIAAGTTNASLVKSNNYFDAITYEGNGSTKVISSLNFQPDFIWIKSRTSAVNHVLFGDGTTITNPVTSFFQWFEF